MEPFGHDIGFTLVSTIAAMYANAHKRKGGRAIKPTDFYSKTVLQAREQSPDEMKSMLMQLVNETGPKKKKKQERAPRKAARKTNDG